MRKTKIRAIASQFQMEVLQKRNEIESYAKLLIWKLMRGFLFSEMKIAKEEVLILIDFSVKLSS